MSDLFHLEGLTVYPLSKNVSSLFFMAQYYYTVHKNQIFLIHSSIDGHVGYFQDLSITNCAPLNTCVHTLLWYEQENTLLLNLWEVLERIRNSLVNLCLTYKTVR